MGYKTPVRKISYIAVNGKSKRDMYFFRNQENTTGREPFLCTDCNRVWQGMSGDYYFEYLGDFPKRGCTHKTCKRCR